MVISLSHADIYLQGNKNFGFTLGSGSLKLGPFTKGYTIVGVSANYFVVDNLELGLGVRAWLGNTPSLQELTLPATYYIPVHEKYRPYLGAFVRHTFIENYDDYNSYGVRAGLAVELSERAYMSFGWVQEFYEKDPFGSSQSNGYPEISIGVVF